jgi:hypothetical protein
MAASQTSFEKIQQELCDWYSTMACTNGMGENADEFKDMKVSILEETCTKVA